MRTADAAKNVASGGVVACVVRAMRSASLLEALLPAILRHQQGACMDFAIRPEIQELRDRIREFLDTRVHPRESEWLRWEEEHFPECVEDHADIRALQKKAQAMGVWAGHLPKDAGGMGLSVADYGLLNEVIGRSYFAPRIFGSNAPDSGNAEILWHFGTPEQKQRFFWPLQKGEVRSFFGMTEPEVSGADPTDLRTTAIRDGGDWVINGHKWFSSNANGSAFGIVMAATDPEAPAVPSLQPDRRSHRHAGARRSCGRSR